MIAFVQSAGFSMHPDFRGRVIAHVRCHHRRHQKASPYQQHQRFELARANGVQHCYGDGHESAGYYRGIAHRSKAVLVKVSNPEGGVKEADILRGLEWVLANHARYRIRIVNASVGGDDVNGDPQHPLHQVVQALTEAGVVVVIAAGDSDGVACCHQQVRSAGLLWGATMTRTQMTANSGNATIATMARRMMARTSLIWLRRACGLLLRSCPIPPSPNKQACWGTYVTAPSSEEHLKRMVRRHHQLLEFTKEQAHQPNETLYQQLQERVHQYKLIHPKYQHVDGTSVAAPIVSGWWHNC
ncbi:MAG UNVERIFIED_CONTAM: S8 family serine peptidase [Anaerolineae bacterium]